MNSITKKQEDNWFTNLLRDLTFKGSFSDVILVLDDHSQMKSHRAVLAASSPFFRNLFRSTNQEDEIVYLSGVLYEELEVILEFIYYGEASSIKNIQEIKFLLNQYKIPFSEEKHPVQDEYFEAKEEIKEELVQIIPDNLQKTKTLFPCNQCDSKYFRIDSLRIHIENKHEGIRYGCNLCNFKSTQKSGLKLHIQSIHEGIKYSCKHCEYKATTQSSLTIHIKSIHEGAKYACNRCDYKARQHSHLSVHIKSKHEGVKYACDHCNYKAGQQSHLKVHIQSNHEGVKYNCDRCNQKFRHKTAMNTHIKSKHRGVKYA